MSVSAPISNTKFADHILEQKPITPGFDLLRLRGKEGLDSTPFPTLRHEFWKYTRVSGLLKNEFQIHRTSVKSLSDSTKKIIQNNPHLVFVNGFFAPELSILPSQGGIRVETIQQNGISESNLDHFPTSWEKEKESFTFLNEASFTDGIVVEVEKNVMIEVPIYIVHITKGDHTATAQRNYIHLNRGSEASFIHLFESDDAASFSNHFNSVIVEEGARINWLELHQNGTHANLISTSVVHQKDSSYVNMGSYVFGGKMSRQNMYVSVLGPNCETVVNGSYILNEKQVSDFRVIVDHKAPHCQSNQTFKGVMGDQSSGVFSGKIYVRKDAQQINAFQTNRNILLSDDANAYSRPQLEIYADDVKCSHGSTIGQLDEDALFYLMARGIRKLEAEKLLVSAFVSVAIENIDNDHFKEAVLDAVAEKIAHF
jgi:Fe-S cluster assembly protein SufD